jgi:hypothetical protein
VPCFVLEGLYILLLLTKLIRESILFFFLISRESILFFVCVRENMLIYDWFSFLKINGRGWLRIALIRQCRRF